MSTLGLYSSIHALKMASSESFPNNFEKHSIEESLDTMDDWFVVL